MKISTRLASSNFYLSSTKLSTLFNFQKHEHYGHRHKNDSINQSTSLKAPPFSLMIRNLIRIPFIGPNPLDFRQTFKICSSIETLCTSSASSFYCCYSTTDVHANESNSEIVAECQNSDDVCQLFREISSRVSISDKTSRRQLEGTGDNSSFFSGKNECETVGNQIGKTSVQRKSAATLASSFCRLYASLPEVSVSSLKISSAENSQNGTNINIDERMKSKHEFLEMILQDDFGVNCTALSSAMEKVLGKKTMPGKTPPKFSSVPTKPIPLTAIHRLRDLSTPQYERIFYHILGAAQNDLGVAFLVQLRKDLRECIQILTLVQKEKTQSNEHESVLFDKIARGSSIHRHPSLFFHRQSLPKIQAMERDIHSILTSLFRPGVLNLQQITYQETPAAIIEQIAFKEAVHPLQSLQDLRKRLGPGRRCFAFFHPALPNKPLVFVHVALLQEIPGSMEDLEIGTKNIVDGRFFESDATCATFYSITNTEPGLAGVDLGNSLIKSVINILREEFPSLDTFCTLSPLPNYKKWLESKVLRYCEEIDRKDNQQIESNSGTLFKFVDRDLFNEDELQQLYELFPPSTTSPLISLLETLKNPSWYSEKVLSSSTKPSQENKTTAGLSLQQNLKPLLLKLAAYYLTIETHQGRPLCPVAKFHIRNGAEMYRLNYLADLSTKGMRNSCGVMINYHYLLDEMEDNHVRYEIGGKIPVREGVKCWLKDLSK